MLNRQVIDLDTEGVAVGKDLAFGGGFGEEAPFAFFRSRERPFKLA